MAQAGAAIFRRPFAKARRAARAVERKAYDASFSYEDDLKKAAAAAESKAAKLSKAEEAAAAAAGQGKERRDKRH